MVKNPNFNVISRIKENKKIFSVTISHYIHLIYMHLMGELISKFYQLNLNHGLKSKLKHTFFDERATTTVSNYK